MPAAPSTWITFAPTRLRERNRDNGISGLGVRACRTTNPTSSATLTAPRPRVEPAVQPSSAAGLTRV